MNRLLMGRSPRVRGLLAGVAAVLVTSCVGPSWFGFSVQVGRPFVIAQSETAQGWGKVAHPFLCRLSPDRIMMTFHNMGDVDEEARGKAADDWPVYTDDGGRTWTAGDPINWVDGNPGHATFVRRGETYSYHYGYAFANTLRGNGERFAMTYEVRLRGTNGFAGVGIRSGDGRNWKGPVAVPFDMAEQVHRLYLAPGGLELPDGTMACFATFRRPGESKRSSAIFCSTNGGARFALRSVIAGPEDAPFGNNGPCEPTAIQLADGTLLCMMRTGSGESGAANLRASMLLARSTDHGFTWTLERMRVPGVCPKLLLLADGTIACAFGRPGNSIMFSTDQGQSWGREIALTRASLRTSGYVDIVETQPGRLLAVYDSHDSTLARFWLWEPPAPVNVIWGAFIEVRGGDRGRRVDPVGQVRRLDPMDGRS